MHSPRQGNVTVLPPDAGCGPFPPDTHPLLLKTRKAETPIETKVISLGRERNACPGQGRPILDGPFKAET